jgi:hypothetical protein
MSPKGGRRSLHQISRELERAGYKQRSAASVSSGPASRRAPFWPELSVCRTNVAQVAFVGSITVSTFAAKRTTFALLVATPWGAFVPASAWRGWKRRARPAEKEDSTVSPVMIAPALIATVAYVPVRCAGPSAPTPDQRDPSSTATKVASFNEDSERIG